MSYRLQHIRDNTWELVFSDEPEYIHALQMAPKEMEPELSSGIWLVVTFPVWCGPARDSVRAALCCAKGYSGMFQLGVRPLYFHQEIYNWWPSSETPPAAETSLAVRNEPPRLEIRLSTDSSSNPIWLVLQDGQVTYQGIGPRSKEQLSQLMQTSIKKSRGA